MSVTATPQTTATSNQVTTSDRAVLGKNDFLKLLVAELQNQDAMNPMDDKAMMAQLAQFNALDQMTQINETLTQFISLQQLADAGNLIGKVVEVTSSEADAPISGTVSRASLVDGTVQIRIGETDYDLNDVIAITGGSTDGAAQG
jgi:flagellar basal-body rod modification protein FlgD